MFNVNKMVSVFLGEDHIDSNNVAEKIIVVTLLVMRFFPYIPVAFEI